MNKQNNKIHKKQRRTNDECSLCKGKNHTYKECEDKNVKANLEITCGCDKKKVSETREQSTRKKMMTHCCKCKKPEVCYNMYLHQDEKHFVCETCYDIMKTTTIRKYVGKPTLKRRNQGNTLENKKQRFTYSDIAKNTCITCEKIITSEMQKGKNGECYKCEERKMDLNMEIGDYGTMGKTEKCGACQITFSYREKEMNGNTICCSKECHMAVTAARKYFKQKEFVNDIEFYIKEEALKNNENLILKGLDMENEIYDEEEFDEENYKINEYKKYLKIIKTFISNTWNQIEINNEILKEKLLEKPIVKEIKIFENHGKQRPTENENKPGILLEKTRENWGKNGSSDFNNTTWAINVWNDAKGKHNQYSFEDSYEKGWEPQILKRPEIMEEIKDPGNYHNLEKQNMELKEENYNIKKEFIAMNYRLQELEEKLRATPKMDKETEKIFNKTQKGAVEKGYKIMEYEQTIKKLEKQVFELTEQNKEIFQKLKEKPLIIEKTDQSEQNKQKIKEQEKIIQEMDKNIFEQENEIFLLKKDLEERDLKIDQLNKDAEEWNKLIEESLKMAQQASETQNNIEKITEELTGNTMEKIMEGIENNNPYEFNINNMEIDFDSLIQEIENNEFGNNNLIL